MGGLAVLLTGFTRATASLGPCPHPKDSVQGRWQGQGLQGQWVPEAPPETPFASQPAWAPPAAAPHLGARHCRLVAHLFLQDRQGFLMGVRPLHEHTPAILPGGLDTELLFPGTNSYNMYPLPPHPHCYEWEP